MCHAITKAARETRVRQDRITSFQNPGASQHQEAYSSPVSDHMQKRFYNTEDKILISTSITKHPRKFNTQNDFSVWEQIPTYARQTLLPTQPMSFLSTAPPATTEVVSKDSLKWISRRRIKTSIGISRKSDSPNLSVPNGQKSGDQNLSKSHVDKHRQSDDYLYKTPQTSPSTRKISQLDDKLPSRMLKLSNDKEAQSLTTNQNSHTHQGYSFKTSKVFSNNSALIITKSSTEKEKAAEFINIIDPTKVSLKLMVLEGESPSKLISQPNVHELHNQLTQRGTRKIENLTHTYLENPTPNNEHLQKTPRQTISVGLNVLVTKPEKSLIIKTGDNVDETNLPIAAPLKQTHPSEAKQNINNKPVLNRDWELDEHLVCQIHNCDSPEKRLINKLERQREYSKYYQSERFKRNEIDFFVGTDILKDIWNNHINAQNDITFEVIDIENDNYKNTQSIINEIQEDLYKLGLGSSFDPAMKPPPVTNNFLSLNSNQGNNEGSNNDGEPTGVMFSNNYDGNEPHETNEETQSMDDYSDFQGDESNQISINNNLAKGNSNFLLKDKKKSFPEINTEFQPPPPPMNLFNYPYDVEYYTNFLNDPDLSHLNLFSSLDENLTPPNDIFPHIHTLSTKLGTPDPIPSPVSHLLPPSVLPLIHADAKEGRIVRNGHSTRIVLRLKPSTTHPNGQVITLPASKFDQFGTANLELSNGQKISVRLKRGKSPKSQSQLTDHEDISHLNNFRELDLFKTGENFVEEEIPITILRDGKTGLPIMAIPGLKPQKETVLGPEGQIIEPLNQPILPSVPSFIPNMNPNFNIVGNPNSPNNFNEPTGFIGQNINRLSNGLLSRFREIMKNINGVTRTVEGNVMNSVNSSIDFIRTFYENVLPENYFDDSMTMMSMAAFMAFLGVRASEISSALAVSSVGRRALEEVESYIGNDLTNHIQQLWDNIILNNKKTNLSEFADRTFPVNYSFSYFDANMNGKWAGSTPPSSADWISSITDNEVHQTRSSSWNQIMEDLEITAQLLDRHLEPLLQSRSQKDGCLQRELCRLTSEGARVGGFAAFLAPIVR